MGDTRKRALLFAAAVAIAAFTNVQSANAATIFTATLTGSGESPPNGSPATGTAVVTFTDVNHFTVDAAFSGLTFPAGAAHIHCCAGSGANASVVLDFVGVGFPVGATSGTFNHTFDLTTDLIGILSLNAFVANLQLGNAYVNIHDAIFPGGEIRGQLIESATPLPAAFPLLATGLATLGLLGWRRKKKAAAPAA